MIHQHSYPIKLRAPEMDDLHLLFEVENDRKLWLYSSNTGPYSRYQMEQYILSNTNDIYTDCQQRFMIVNPDDETQVYGIADIFNFDARNNRAEVGILVLPDFRGKGIARKALDELSSHSFGFLGLEQLYAFVISDNIAAQNLFRSSGYEEVGLLKSWLRRGSYYIDVNVYQKLIEKT